jgi:hypothetical protein
VKVEEASDDDPKTISGPLGGLSQERLELPCASSPPCWKNLWPTGATGRSPAFAPRSKRARACASAVRNCPRPCEKKFRWRPAPAHAEGTSDGKRGGRPAPATAQTAGRSGRHCSAPAPAPASPPPTSPRPRRSRCWGHSITSRANSSSTPARPSAAAISSPIWSNSSVSLDRSPGDRPSRSCWSRTMVRSTPANIEPVWRDLKAHQLAHQTCTSALASPEPRSGC